MVFLKSKLGMVAGLVFLLPALAQGQNLESLAPLFLKKVVTLRNFYGSDYLRYDSAGTLIGRSEAGPWTMYGRLEIDRFAVHKDKLQIGASRLLVVYDQKRGADYRYIRWQPNTLIEIDVSPNTSVTDLKKALGRVFMTSSEKFSDLAPAYWRSFLAGAEPNTGPAAPGLPKEKRSPNSDSAPAIPQPESEGATSTHPDQTPAADPGGGIRVKVSQGVMSAMLIKQVVPTYPALAKLARVSGQVVLRVIINLDGSVGEVQIEHPAGAGMDDAAVEAVRQWKYERFLLKGNPVQVQTQVTVKYTLGT